MCVFCVCLCASHVCLQLDDVLTRLTEQEKVIAFVGTTVVQTEQLLRELELLDKQAKASQPNPNPNPQCHRG